MESFILPLKNNSKVAGIHCNPARSVPTVSYRPLVVGLHGGTYRSNYFDGNAKHTASIASNAFGVPFVSIDRPCYGGTGSFLPIPEGSSFEEQTGLWLHKYILPALWSEYGAPNDCSCIVILSHSLGAMGAIVAAAMHSQDPRADYPLGGIITSGLATRHLTLSKEEVENDVSDMPAEIMFTHEMKDAIMFRPGTIDPAILAETGRLNSPAPCEEFQSLRPWLSTWDVRWAAKVTVPVMFALSEQDSFFEGTQEHVDACAANFTKSSRVDTSLIRGAPHCLELSHWSQGWYARCFGFAMECAATFSVITA